MQPHELGAVEAAHLIRQGALSCEDLIRSCLERIARRDGAIRAWTHVDPDLALRTARECDKAPSVGPLHGLPMGFKDIFATADMPTTYNSPLHADQWIGRDAGCVATVKGRGGIVLGKTDTVEFASGGRTALTRNPVNPAHTPGGSSSGSAAAVADLHVPISFGSQTGGSIIRPASFTGVYALKPTFGVVSYEGIKNVSPSLDTVGWYCRSVTDLALVGSAFRLPGMDDHVAAQPEGLRVGLCRTPMWDKAEPSSRAAVARAGERLARAGCEVFELSLPGRFDGLVDAAKTIGDAERRAIFLSEAVTFGPRLSPSFHAKADHPLPSPAALREAYGLAEACRAEFDGLFGPRLDVVIAPAATGEAPEGLAFTGDAVFNTFWTLLHGPCVAVPAGSGPTGLPVGVQLVGPRFEDARLLRLAEALAPAIDVPGPLL